MYRYDQFDHQITAERVAQFRDQVRRRLSGELKEDEFRILRLQNGLYMQIHAYMLRVAVPYGLISAAQMRMFASIARKYDRGYGHFTTRQNIQFNWFKLQDAPEALADLATVEMHANQTSGNCIRNITCDEFAGVARDEIVDPRPYAEILRQWSTFHPEFGYLPRKFKFAISGAEHDRAAIAVHDIGLSVVKNAQGEVGFRVLVGGGLGRTPIVGTEICDFVPWQHAITYLESIVRVYNEHGRRDNIYKARIKILVKALGIEEFKRQVEADWQFTKNGPCTITEAELNRVSACFTVPAYEQLPEGDSAVEALQRDNKAFANWLQRNIKPHKVPGYAAVVLSLKKTGIAPGDATAEQMDAAAELADRFSFGELRITHMQNLVLADVRQSDLVALWKAADAMGMATPNIGLLNDVICCPGSDFCTLANARSISLAKAIAERFDNIDFQHDIGDIELNISGCINACGHHHIGHIGILGVDKDGEDWYQVSIGGSQGNSAGVGKVIGSSFAFSQMPEVVARLLEVYVRERHADERFIDTVRRIGHGPFKEYVYATPIAGDAKLDGAEYASLEKGTPYDMPYYSRRF
ncbi:sulfite reductase [Ferrigenium kumadai]|uniref:Sulfite reductase n=1 Tax=Ferrigenium kumadai TaxID=1682490 RepID=A0AAN1W053_9PROT|nr:nitrite/sulfite reductase [Ferrigenium kumadai]BBJ00100.1 sulfite reductase [Ferrigenium kumadai]